MRIGRRSLLRATLGLAISGIAIVILIRSVDLGAALGVLAGADPAWVVVMIIATLLDVGARAARWRALLAPIKVVRYLRVLGYTYIGYLANSVLPARLGELVRSHALGENENVSRTTVLGTVVVERIVDTAFVVALAAVAVLVLSARGVMTSAPSRWRSTGCPAPTAWRPSWSAGRGSSSSVGACETASPSPASRARSRSPSASARWPGSRP
jgi:hypothetical protein